MFFNKNSSLKHKILIYTVIASSIMSAIFTFASLAVDYKLDVKKMDEQISNVELTTLGSLKGALWDLNIKLINVQLRDLLRIEGVDKVELFDEENKSIFQKEKKKKGNTYFDSKFEKVYPINFQVAEKKAYGGKLVVLYNRDHIFYNTLTRAFIVFVTQVFKTFFVSFILIYLYELLITKDLVNISSFLKKVDVSKTSFDDEIDKRDQDDEISTIQEQLNLLLKKISLLNKENQSLIDEANKEKKVQEAKALNASRLASLGEMAAGIAHEINNPLTIIQSQSFILKKRVEKGEVVNNEDVSRLYEKTQVAIDRIAKIIRNMKKVSRHVDGEEITRINLLATLQDTLEYFAEKSAIRDITFTYDVSSEIDVYAMDVQLSQVTANLLNNSVDAASLMDISNRWIKVKALDAGDDIIISFTDSGPGIKSDLKEKIFNPFFTTKDIGKGTGLGLSISLEAIKSMNGVLSLNEDSLNTEFVITIPKAS